MDLDEARAVVREQHHAVLATERQDGTPQLSPVLVAVDDEGRALISTRLLVDYFRRVSGEHDDWDDYRAAMQREGRVLVRVELTDAGPDRSG